MFGVIHEFRESLRGMGRMMFTKYIVVVVPDDDVDVHNTTEVRLRLCANTESQNVEPVSGENRFALIFVKLCHDWVLFPRS